MGTVPLSRTEPLIDFLRKVPLFSGLSEEALADLARKCRRRSHAAGETLFYEGDPGQTLYIVASGAVNIQKKNRTADASATRSAIHIALRGPGEYFGDLSLLDDAPRSADAVTDTACDLVLLDRADLQALLEVRPTMAWTLLRTLAARLREAADQTRTAESLDTMGRLCAFLLRESKEGTRPVAMTDEQIAARLSTSRETVNRKLSQLRRAGAVRRDGRRSIIVLRLERLQRLCEE